MGLFNQFARRAPDAGDAAEPLNLLRQQSEAILDQLKTLSEQVSRLALRESQVRAVLQRDAELEGHHARLMEVVGKTNIGNHIERVVRRAELHLDPFPHAVIDDVLPADLYGCLLRGIPPVELFGDRPVNKQQLAVPFSLAPAYANRVWRFVATAITPDIMVPRIVDKFRAPIDDWIAQNWPDVAPESVQFHGSDGRLIPRRRGYRIPPHRDPKWGFVTCILYLARRDDSESWGTQLYTVDTDEEARGAAPHWVDPARCRRVADVAFRPNRMLVLLNSVGAHGAQIPEDAQPETLERYIYQFRIAPTVESMALLKSTLPEERRPFWAGKSTDY